ncbi:MAG: hypothetical protein ACYC56_04635 [Candidatus Aquicultor sp.]
MFWAIQKVGPLLAHAVGTKRLARIALRLGGGPKLSRELLKRFDAMVPTDPDKIAHVIRETNKFDSRPWLGQITAKTLIVAGHFLVLTHTDKLVGILKGFLLKGDSAAAI